MLDADIRLDPPPHPGTLPLEDRREARTYDRGHGRRGSRARRSGRPAH
jgi:hypothetical protein